MDPWLWVTMPIDHSRTWPHVPCLWQNEKGVVDCRFPRGACHHTPLKVWASCWASIVTFEDMPFLYNTVPRCKPIFASGAPPKKPQSSQHQRKNWLCEADWDPECQFLVWRFSRAVLTWVDFALLTNCGRDSSVSPKEKQWFLVTVQYKCTLRKTFKKSKVNVICTSVSPDRS